MTVRINYPNDRAVGRCFVAFEWKRSLFAATPKDEFANTATDSVESDGRLALWVEIGVERLNDQELSPVKRLILNRRNDITDDASDLHLIRTIYLINDANDRGIDRTIFVAFG